MAERLACVIVGYFFGCLLTAQLFVWLKTGRKLPSESTGNPGTAYIADTFGARGGAAVLLGDLMKTVFACALCQYVLFPALGRQAALYAGLGACIGHCWPFWNKFHGGKGIAVTIAASLLFSPAVGLISAAAAGTIVVLCGYLAAGSAVLAAAFPIVTALFGYPVSAVWGAAGMGFIILVRHRANFRRIKEHTEPRKNFSQRMKGLKK